MLKDYYIQQLNPWWKKKSFKFKVINRDYYVDSILDNSSRLINILLGARRVGKTHILYSLINYYLNKLKPKQILFLSDEISSLNSIGLKKIIEEYLEVTKQDLNSELYIFIDEIQEIKNWQKTLKLFYDLSNFKFFVSGSSSLVLSKEIHKLTGRFFLQKVHPLSFKEYLKFTNQNIKKVSKSKNTKQLIEYLKVGGYPEHVLNRQPTYLKQAIESTLYRELFSHFGIRNPEYLETMLLYLSDKVTNAVSVKNLQKDLNINEGTVKSYLDYLQKIFLLHKAYKYGKSNKITKNSNPKYYFSDNGFLNLYTKSLNIGALVENAFYLELLRKNNKQEHNNIYYNEYENQEVDFMHNDVDYEIKSGQKLLEKDLEKYENLEKYIYIVTLYPQNKSLVQKFNYLKIISLKDFLLNST